ncbi:telomere length regulation TEL2 family protein [Aspergillus luchuensis]|uniref:Telomere binding protein n=1 Tax=Aspergillus kawachii TaxID=1069201 RepID=A0A7R7ZVI1_ASPKA|nr:telomere binding protein [Aspergillus luchuensis]BCR96228.1 telomere binding protein [Aspergillus luchuensis]BCS08745.1 telomere binding protein [Aspergillus luchuensis]
MDGLLTAVKTVKHSQQPILSAAAEGTYSGTTSNGSENRSKADLPGDPTSSEHILAILKAKPDEHELAQVLVILDPSNKTATPNGFDIRVPRPVTAQILNALVIITIPDHWEALGSQTQSSKSGNSKLRAALLRCLSSVAGISCLVTQLRSLIAASRSSAEQAKSSGHKIQIRDTLAVISALLEPSDFAFRLYADMDNLYSNATQKQVAWRELLSVLAASKVLSTAAEALNLISELDGISTISWIGEGSKYATWLGSNICYMASKTALSDEEAWKSVALLTGRSLSLGYTDQVVKEIYTGLLVRRPLSEQYSSLFDRLRPTEQLALLEAVFRDLEKKQFSGEIPGDSASNTSGQVVSSVAALCSMAVSKRSHLQSQIIDWLSKGQGGSIHSLGLRRALVATLAQEEDSINTLLSKSLDQSGDKFYIQHAPIRCQEANAQVVLLAAGYLQRLDAAAMMFIGRTGLFLNTVSNRLAASSPRARFLGMLIGTTISQLIEQQGKGMRFDLEEMESDEAHWYLDLAKLHDSIGSIESIESLRGPPATTEKDTKNRTSSTNMPKKDTRKAKIVAIEEVNDSDQEDEEDEDLIPYEKPDEDPSDSDDDPTLVQRNKPTAPVYIRDLITYLRDTENVERYELAVSTAPSLIRRKTGFGTELAENIEELALVVVGLQEHGKIPRFQEIQLQSMIALIVSQPLKMGHWFSAIFFDGDLSQPQRSTILTALGLSARELGGNGEADAKALGLPRVSDASFPSKKLPGNLEALYQPETESPIASLTKQLSRASLEPLAADASDSLSGPNALKVRTFSSRMEVEKKRQQREAQRQKSTAKDLYRVLADGFFYPLKGRFEMMIMQFSSSTAPSYNPFYAPHLLSLFTQTLTLIFSTMGPHTPHLAAVTHETLTFLLSLHARPISDDPGILSSLLSLFLAAVDLNVASGTSGEERLVTEFATQVMELREWVGEIFDRTPPVQDTSDPREQVRTLAAGVMVKLGEVIERYQGRLMGVNSGFRY